MVANKIIYLLIYMQIASGWIAHLCQSHLIGTFPQMRDIWYELVVADTFLKFRIKKNSPGSQ